MKFKVEDVSEKLHLMIEILGEEKFLEVVRFYGGDRVYIPTYKSVVRSMRNDDILRRYNGINENQLAMEYGVSTNQIRRIIK